MSFDALRRKHPDLGFAVYGIDPAGPVTLEVHACGGVATYEAATFDGCVLKAFPPQPKPSNELRPLPSAAKPAPAEEIDLTIPDFLRRSVAVAPAKSAEAGSTPATEPTSPDSVFD